MKKLCWFCLIGISSDYSCNAQTDLRFLGHPAKKIFKFQGTNPAIANLSWKIFSIPRQLSIFPTGKSKGAGMESFERKGLRYNPFLSKINKFKCIKLRKLCQLSLIGISAIIHKQIFSFLAIRAFSASRQFSACRKPRKLAADVPHKLCPYPLKVKNIF